MDFKSELMDFHPLTTRFWMDFIWISWYIVDYGIWYTNMI
jgi:hypothetical protein